MPRPLMCIQCAMKALVENRPVPIFNEEPDVHTRLYHSDAEATRLERLELERKLEELGLKPPR